MTCEYDKTSYVLVLHPFNWLCCCYLSKILLFYASPFVPTLETKSVVPEVTTGDSGHWWSSFNIASGNSLVSNRRQAITLQWRHNERDGVLNHRRLDCLLNILFRRRSKKTSKLRVTGLHEGNPPLTGGSPHKGPVTRKMLQFDDVIMITLALTLAYQQS